LASIALAIATLTAMPPAKAQIPVIDAAAILQLISQLEELQRHYEMLVKQYKAITGDYGIGSAIVDIEFIDQVPATWLEVVANQKSGKYGALQEKYEQVVRTVDADLLSDTVDGGRTKRAYQMTQREVKSAFSMAEVIFESLDKRTRNLMALQAQIDTTPNIKAAMDLNSRIQVENSYILADIARMSGMQNRLQGNLVNYNTQGTARHAEFFREKAE
jgi:type IV secretion system protein VirB5